MHKIVIVGGNGFLGSRCVRALANAPGIAVQVAGRRGPLVIDLTNPATFAALDGANVVVNVSSSHTAAPDALARFCLERGITMLEASSDRVVMERLLDAHRDSTGPGALVLGAGIFTGLSNAMAGAVAAALPGAEELVLGVCSSPFSGAGAGTIDLMADAAAIPTRTIRDGRRVEDPIVSTGPALPFPGGARRTIRASFAEPVMAHASTKIPHIAMYIALRPPFLRFAFLALPAFVLRSWLFQAYMRVYFRVIRRVLLRSVSTRVELLARARRGSETRLLTLHAADGMRVGGVAIAATALLLAQRETKGTYIVDERVTFTEMLTEIRRLAPDLDAAALGSSDDA